MEAFLSCQFLFSNNTTQERSTGVLGRKSQKAKGAGCMDLHAFYFPPQKDKYAWQSMIVIVQIRCFSVGPLNSEIFCSMKRQIIFRMLNISH